MNRKWSFAVCGAVLALSLACSQPNQEKIDEKSAKARSKVHDALQRADADARRLGRDARSEASSLSRNLDHAMNSGGSASSGTLTAEEKLRQGAQDLRAAGQQAQVKLTSAATLAKVKSQLASTLGFSAMTAIGVDASGGVVTLTGSVASEDVKNRAVGSAKQVDGVTSVIDELAVKP